MGDSERREDVTRLLQEVSSGRAEVIDQLLPAVYDELRRVAGGYLRKERPDHTLEPTALVHEAYLRVVDQKAAGWKDRAHFLAVAARVMRQILVDHARRHRARKRRGARLCITLDRIITPVRGRDIDVLALDEALEKLHGLDERKGRVVELRFFAGLTMDEVAEALGVSIGTVESDWYMARAWLRNELARER